MKISKRKRRGDISTIIIALVFVLLVLIAVPFFKSLANSNASTAKNSNDTYTTFGSESDTFAGAGASLENPFK